jgi:hypothetical protein
MTDEQADRIITLLEQILPMKEKIDEISEALPLIETLGEVVLFRKNEADQMLGLNKQTLSKSKTANRFEEVGKRKVYVDLQTVSVYSSKKKKSRGR